MSTLLLVWLAFLGGFVLRGLLAVLTDEKAREIEKLHAALTISRRIISDQKALIARQQ